MSSYRVVGLPPAVAQRVRETRTSPFAEHPTHVEVARGYGPCRSCLQTFAIGEDRRILFTYDPFAGLEPFPLPGPVFIHESACEPYPADAGFPEALRGLAFTLNAYGRGRALRAQERVGGEEAEASLQRLLARSDVDYVHVRDTEAGCFDFRVERM